ncbi:hypothetical protein [Photobacterium iliopiscarium]|uniref:hypothetical protein n=1 Tax=Photobacterium iliopiscarium TaxID=56192 RepID=UPI00242FFB71|nr:hypothetical protein [Photobacterium iliopiscarium]
MKKLSFKENERNIKQSIRLWNNSLSRVDKTYNRYKIYSKKGTKKAGSCGSNTSHLFAPEKLCIYDTEIKSNTYVNTINFINNISLIQNKTKVIIDFSQTYQLTAPVALMIYAAIDTIPYESKPKISIVFSKDCMRVNKLLHKSGLYSLCRGSKLTPDFSGKIALSVVSGVGGKYRDEIVDFIQSRAYSNDMDAETEFVFGDAVQETINNVRLHAYPERLDSDKKWWLLCEVIGNQLFLAIYDQGIGIPKTVTDRDWFFQLYEKEYPEEYKGIIDEVNRIGLEDGFLSPLKLQVLKLKKWKDYQLVYLSMLGNVTGTKKLKHGQGSKSIKALVKANQQGKLFVYSNEGLYCLEDKLESSDCEKKGYGIQLPKSIKGTLVQWNINIK